jgi:transporter family-2 protein
MKNHLAGLAAALAGSLVPVQTSVNAMLAASLGNSLAAAGVSMAGSGLILLPMVAVQWSRSRATAYQEFRPWMLLGGTFGAAYVASLILLSQPLGLAATFVAAEAGVMTVAMVLDSIGFAGSTVRSVTRLRVLGVCMPVLACVMLEGPAAVADAEAGGLRARLLRVTWALAAGGCKPLQAGMCAGLALEPRTSIL